VVEIMSIKDSLRTLLKIRVLRELSPPGPKPLLGSNIVRDRLRIRLKHPISVEQWEWFTKQGWRTVDMRSNRRRYVMVPDKVLLRLLDAKEPDRSALHQRLIQSVPGGSSDARIAAAADSVITEHV
jgi:hypothetical protein